MLYKDHLQPLEQISSSPEITTKRQKAKAGILKNLRNNLDDNIRLNSNSDINSANGEKCLYETFYDKQHQKCLVDKHQNILKMLSDMFSTNTKPPIQNNSDQIILNFDNHQKKYCCENFKAYVYQRDDHTLKINDLNMIIDDIKSNNITPYDEIE